MDGISYYQATEYDICDGYGGLLLGLKRTDGIDGGSDDS